MKIEHLCGLSCWHPVWIQKYANSKVFLIVYGLLGTIQAMSFLYFVVTLTTIEKRFKIPSQTTGIILSGNEISQILLSLILSYYAGQRNRPRWISIGVVFCSISCFILASPHFIYGPGDDAIQLTKEYIIRQQLNLTTFLPINGSYLENAGRQSIVIKGANKLCLGINEPDECDELFSIVPLVLIFLSQFVLGIGNTLYYSLGQSYLDDNTKKTNTPMMLAYALSLRMFGPVIGFFLGYVALNTYIDPTKTPIIDRQDPRWLGAWWLGWIILGFAMLIFSFLIGLFPKELPKKKINHNYGQQTSDETPKVLRTGQLNHDKKTSTMNNNNNNHFGYDQDQNEDENGDVAAVEDKLLYKSKVDYYPYHHKTDDALQRDVLGSLIEFPRLKNFPTALLRLLKNKLIMFNIISGIFYILGSSGYITFISKYMEVQFNKNPSEATIITGPLTIIGMVSGFLLSGFIITKFRPPAKKLFFWNVIVGIGYMLGQISYLFLTCDNGNVPAIIQQQNHLKQLNLTTACNANCYCVGVPYSPVCDLNQGITYFSPCHAACNKWDDVEKIYSNCGCGGGAATMDDPMDWNSSQKTTISDSSSSSNWLSTTTGTTNGLFNYYESTTTNGILSNSTTIMSTTMSSSSTTTSKMLTESSIIIDFLNITSGIDVMPTESNGDADHIEEATVANVINDDVMETTTESISSSTEKAAKIVKRNAETTIKDPDWLSSIEKSTIITTPHIDYETTSRSRQDDGLIADLKSKLIMKPGACMEGCATKFYLFTFISILINWLGATGRISNILVTFRGVAKEDKSFTQGLALMLISLFALIPGPIFYGWLIDKACILWNYKCDRIGNCQLYDQTAFRYYINIAACSLTFIGVLFDLLVWHHGKHLDLYGEREEEHLRKNRVISPLITAATGTTEKKS